MNERRMKELTNPTTKPAPKAAKAPVKIDESAEEKE
jgi:hypothetical protein